MSRSTISTFNLFEMYPNEASARVYLESRLWPNGVTCPDCKSMERITVRKDGYYRCNACKLDFTVRTGTIFERSHVPLHKWLYAMYLLVTARKGISSMQLAKEIGITQKSAWFVLIVSGGQTAHSRKAHRMSYICGPCEEARHDQCDKPNCSCNCHVSTLKILVAHAGILNERERKVLDRVTDVVLAYRPKPKSKAAKKRAPNTGNSLPAFGAQTPTPQLQVGDYFVMTISPRQPMSASRSWRYS